MSGAVPLRVLLVTHVFPRHDDDPTAPFLLRYAVGLVAAGAQVTVVAPHDPGLPARHEVRGVPVERVRYGADRRETIAYRGEMHRRARTPGGAVQALRLLVALWRRVRAADRAGSADVVDVHWVVPSAVAVALAGGRTPARVIVHGTDLALVQRSALGRRVGRWLLGRFDQVAAVSDAMAAELERELGTTADVVAPMPMALPRTAPGPPPGRDHVLAVGRLVPEKGHADLVRAVARLRDGGHAVALTIVGDGPEGPRLARVAAELGVPLALPGAVGPEALDRAYRDADVVCVPSHREGFGLVAAEALAHRRPVVTTGAGGLADIVTDAGPEPTGWRFPVGDVEALAGALTEALTQREEAARRAKRGEAAVRRRWSPEALGAQAHEQLTALAGRAATGTGAARRDVR